MSAIALAIPSLELGIFLLALSGTACDALPSANSYRRNTAPTHDSHPFFPLDPNSGHDAVTCDECHGPATTFTTTQCISCHVHAKFSENLIHSGVVGYVYTSSACLACHPSPEIGKATP